MKLPNAGRAVVDINKLRSYCLSRTHPRGKHKARVFAATLGLTASHAAVLKQAILEAVLTYEAMPGKSDEYGRRYSVDFPMHGPQGSTMVRTTWIVRNGEDAPRLTSCYVL